MPRAQDISICFVGFETHKAHPDLTHDSGFWFRIEAKDAAPFIVAFKDSPDVSLSAMYVGQCTVMSRPR